MRTRDRHTTRIVAAGLATAAGLALAGCGAEEEPEAGTDVEDVVEGEVVETTAPGEDAEAVAEPGAPYIGPYNREFYDEAETTYAGQEVTLTGEVEEVFSTDSPTAITISDPNDLELGDLLVISETAMADLEQDQVVEVVGTVQADFQLTQVETELALDLEDEWFQDFEGDPYIEATEIRMEGT